jgi:hypothetical protein
MKYFLIFMVVLLHLQILMAQTGKYNRADWPHWLDEDGDCQDTRQEVLIKDAEKVKLAGDDSCYVKKGIWYDPYTAKTLTSPKQIQIDHLVPLKNASDSGGFAWTKEQKAIFANDTMNLFAVSAAANQTKSAKTPDQWKPIKDHWCSFSKTWIDVKAKYGLSMRLKEKSSLSLMIHTCTITVERKEYLELLAQF